MGIFIGFSALIILQSALITISLANRITPNTKGVGIKCAGAHGRPMNEN